MNMARRALAELRRGDVVNLGIGIPTLVADLIAPGGRDHPAHRERHAGRRARSRRRAARWTTR